MHMNYSVGMDVHLFGFLYLGCRAAQGCGTTLRHNVAAQRFDPRFAFAICHRQDPCRRLLFIFSVLLCGFLLLVTFALALLLVRLLLLISLLLLGRLGLLVVARVHRRRLLALPLRLSRLGCPVGRRASLLLFLRGTTATV